MKPQFIFIGLGNPGASYEITRHNIGFLAAELLKKHYANDMEWTDKQKFLSHIIETTIFGVPSLIIKPQTFMNRSGEAIQKILTFYKLQPQQILVCSDDIDLPLGTFRLKLHGSAGTHNGLKSIVDVVGEDFPRLRIGIGPKPENADLAAWVLSALSKEEQKELTHVFAHIPELINNHLKQFKMKNEK